MAQFQNSPEKFLCNCEITDARESENEFQALETVAYTEAKDGSEVL